MKSVAYEKERKTEAPRSSRTKSRTYKRRIPLPETEGLELERIDLTVAVAVQLNGFKIF